MFEEKLQFAKLRGKTIRSIFACDGPRIDFHLSDGSVYSLEAPCQPRQKSGSYEFLGDIAVLTGSPVLAAELSTCDEYLGAPFQPVVCYRLRTVNGSAAIRISGDLTGFSSVAVDFLTLQHSGDSDSRVTPARGSSVPGPAARPSMAVGAFSREAPSGPSPFDLDNHPQPPSPPRPMQAFRVRFSVSSQAILEAQDRRHSESAAAGSLIA